LLQALPEERIEVQGRVLDMTRVDVGNPHCVVFGGFSATSEIRDLGRFFETHPLFPQRSNVQFVKVLSRELIEIEIWERGSSYTLASGSSSCAAAYAAYKRGLLDAKLRVKMPGGELAIEILNGENLRMTGPVTRIALGECRSPGSVDC
jgi:diaminopimelate epimerase